MKQNDVFVRYIGEKRNKGEMSTTKAKYSQPDAKEIDKCIYEIANGNDAALEQLYNLTYKIVYAYALSVTKNRFDAQDVTHDCFVRIFESAHKYSSNGKPMAWILTVAKNFCYSRFRDRSKVADVPDEDLDRYFADNTSMSVEDVMLVKYCLTQLSDEERTIVVLHAMSGLKHRDIAAQTELPLAMVITKYHRALKKLKIILQGERT